MREVRIVADDLTGALDSGCAFASTLEPVIVGLPWRSLPWGRKIAFSTESRDQTEEIATGRVRSAVLALNVATAGDAIWFKKVDSVLRGHAIAETKVAFSAGNFDHCVFAPAFPAMGRMTAGGRQFTVTADGVATPVGPNFVDAFLQSGLASKIFDADNKGSVSALPLPDVLLVDADDQQKLASRIAVLSGQLRDRRVLWSGAGGLAAAFGGTPPAAHFPPVRYIIVGTNHPTTRAQTLALSVSGLVTTIPRDEYAKQWVQLPHLIAPALTAASADETAERIRWSVQDMQIEDPQNTSIIVTGGATLSNVLQAAGVEFLECVGEAMTGIAVSRVRGGRWEGITVLSKSGGFGTAQIFADLLKPHAVSMK